MKNRARIRAVARYLPEKVMTNADFEKIVDTSDEWIFSRTGIRERRVAGVGEECSTMGSKAAKIALKRAGIEADTVDLILVATLTPDYIFPSTACLIQKEIGASNAASLDFQAACSGFVYGMNMAKAYIESGAYKNILFVAAEKLSAVTDYTDRGTCVLFGDGASACLISDSGPGLAIVDTVLGSDGCQAEILVQPGGGSRMPPTVESVETKQHFIKMDGREVFKHAVKRMIEACVQVLEKNKLTGSDITWMIPHQANIRIIDAIAKRFDIDPAKVYKTVHKYGNTSASSIGIALDECLEENPLKENERILVTAFGAGLTWGSGLLQWVSK